MTSRITRIEALAIAALALAACNDNKSELLAPQPPDKMIIWNGGGGIIVRPVLPSPDDLVEITAGELHSCARKYGGAVYCWGGAFGDQPTLVQLPAATHIDAGDNYTCALTKNPTVAGSGPAYCWGANVNGQLGIGSTSAFVKDPTPVAGGLSFYSMSAGWRSTCGLSTSGVYCWGLLARPSASTPTLISGYNGYASVTVGEIYGCATYNVGGYTGVDCWGNNGYGQTGQPMTGSVVPFTMPTLLGSSVSSVSAQYEFTCADQRSGIVQCFGDDQFGQLGNGQSGAWVKLYQPQTVIASASLHGVSTGTWHACALDPNGAGWCWGSGSSGQLGTNSQPKVGMPQPVQGGLTFRAVAAGGSHSCGIGTDNHIYCWGDNSNHQLGTPYDRNGQPNMLGYSTVPVRAIGL